MIIKVADLIGNKFIKLEVDPATTLSEIIDVIIEKLGLPRDYSYSIVYKGREFTQEHFNKSLEELGLSDGDEIQLIGRPIGAFNFIFLYC